MRIGTTTIISLVFIYFLFIFFAPTRTRHAPVVVSCALGHDDVSILFSSCLSQTSVSVCVCVLVKQKIKKITNPTCHRFLCLYTYIYTIYIHIIYTHSIYIFIFFSFIFSTRGAPEQWTIRPWRQRVRFLMTVVMSRRLDVSIVFSSPPLVHYVLI